MAATFPHLQFNNKETVSTFKAGYNSGNVDGLGLVHADTVHLLTVSTDSRQSKECLALLSLHLRKTA